MLQFRLDDLEQASGLLDEAFALLSRWAEDKPRRADLQSAATKASQKLSLVAFANGDFGGAVASALSDERRLGEAVAAGAPLAEEHADAINNVAWYSLFTDDPQAALTAALRATDMRPDSKIYQLNLAHALLFSGREGEAITLYRADGTDEWRAMIASDFEAFSAYGVAPVLIDNVRRALLQ